MFVLTWLIVFAQLVFPAIVRGSEFSDDLVARRARVMERLGPEAILILWSAPVRNYSLDIDYEYRQDSNLYYLTGLTQEETILVLMPGNRTRREILFLKEKDFTEEHWRGVTLSADEASARTGIRTVLARNRFEPFVAAMLGRRDFDPIGSDDTRAFSEALGAGRAKVALLGSPERVDPPLTPPMEFARRLREQYAGFQTLDATPILTGLRLLKTPYERKLLIKSVEISDKAQEAGMLATRAGAYEYEVKAAVEASQRERGAASWAYPSIVGSGPNATILHYPQDDRQMNAGELLLVDAGANYQYMAADVTRTYPVDGTFTRLQKDIYNIVLQAQDEGIKVASAGGSLAAIHNKTVEVIRAGLFKLGLITDPGGDQYKMWFTHSAGHYLGIDVHDPGDRNQPLQAGMAFAIEPGLYIRQSALDALPRTPENLALIEHIQPAVAKYADIGVRIEDSFLFDATGLRRLSADLPRTADEIEAFMHKRK